MPLRVLVPVPLRVLVPTLSPEGGWSSAKVLALAPVGLLQRAPPGQLPPRGVERRLRRAVLQQSTAILQPSTHSPPGRRWVPRVPPAPRPGQPSLRRSGGCCRASRRSRPTSGTCFRPGGPSRAPPASARRRTSCLLFFLPSRRQEGTKEQLERCKLDEQIRRTTGLGGMYRVGKILGTTRLGKNYRNSWGGTKLYEKLCWDKL